MPRHGAGRDAALEAIAHHQLVAGTQRGNERIEAGEVVAVVGIAHDDVTATCRLNADGKRRAVPPQSNGHHPRAVTLRDLLAAVGRAVVGNEDFARDPRPLEETLRLADAGRKRLGLIEARHQDGELDFGQAIRPGGRFGPYSPQNLTVAC
jgi:hypothetical protein